MREEKASTIALSIPGNPVKRSLKDSKYPVTLYSCVCSNHTVEFLSEEKTPIHKGEKGRQKRVRLLNPKTCNYKKKSPYKKKVVEVSVQ